MRIYDTPVFNKTVIRCFILFVEIRGTDKESIKYLCSRYQLLFILTIYMELRF